MSRILFAFVFVALFVAISYNPAHGASEHETKRLEMIKKGIEFLRESQAENGSFSSHAGVGPSGIVLCGLLEAGLSPSDPMLEKGLAYLQKSVQKDGGIYTAGGRFGNYESCVAVMCFSLANNKIKDEKKLEKGPFDELLEKSVKYVRSCQYTEEQGKSPDDVYYGGSGYGNSMRPDLSNTHFFIEALKSTGVKEDDPAIQKALVFVSRCQNLESDHNTLAFAAKNGDGGFIYCPVGEGDSPAGETANGGLRSYGSMSYAGLKSMIYAGLTPEDPRVKAAYEWVSKHYDTESNPGLGQSGLYYYYQILSKTLEVLDMDKLKTEDGKEKNWKADLIAAFSKRQNEDGSWSNTNTRWMEGDPNLVTGYALMVLADCREEKK